MDRKPSNLRQAARTCGTAMLLALPAVTPAFAAADPLPLTPHNLLLAGSIALLILGVALKARESYNARRAPPQEELPDLRWWKNA